MNKLWGFYFEVSLTLNCAFIVKGASAAVPDTEDGLGGPGSAGHSSGSIHLRVRDTHTNMHKQTDTQYIL